MDEKQAVIAGVIAGILATSLFGIIVFFYPVFSSGYQQGQLDYQRGKIKYELTETGYKEIVEVKE